MKLLSGIHIANQRAVAVAALVAGLSVQPKLAIIRVGDRADSLSYVKRKVKFAEAVAMVAEVHHFAATVSEVELLQTLATLNADKSVHGIIVQLPLPDHHNSTRIINAIDPKKDVDGLTDYNICKLFSNEPGIVPATPRGVLTLLQAYDIPIAGKHVVVLGRSRLVGKSVSLLLQNQDATVTMCHSKTENLATLTKLADILVVAIGRQKFITAEHVRDGQIVIDVGIGVDDDDRMVGDVDFNSVKDMDIGLTPVPGGVGPMTVASLFENLLDVCRQQQM